MAKRAKKKTAAARTIPESHIDVVAARKRAQRAGLAAFKAGNPGGNDGNASEPGDQGPDESGQDEAPAEESQETE